MLSDAIAFADSEKIWREALQRFQLVHGTTWSMVIIKSGKLVSNSICLSDFAKRILQFKTSTRNWTREKQILHEQRRQIVNDLSDAVQDLKRSFTVYELQYNRLQGALDQLKAVEKTNALKKAPINLVLEAQRRVLDAQTQLFRSKIEYVLALRNVHLEKGTLLENKQIVFSDSTDPNGMMMNPVSETISKSNSMTESFVMPLASERTSSNKKNSQPLSSATVSNSSLASQRRQIGGSQNSNRTKLPAQIPRLWHGKTITHN